MVKKKFEEQGKVCNLEMEENEKNEKEATRGKEGKERQGRKEF